MNATILSSHQMHVIRFSSVNTKCFDPRIVELIREFLSTFAKRKKKTQWKMDDKH